VKYFVVTYIRPDDTGWDEHLRAHVAYLNGLVEAGSLRASGPLLDTSETSSMLILSAESREDALDLITADPYVAECVVTDYTVAEWDPMFGEFQTPRHRLVLSQLDTRFE